MIEFERFTLPNGLRVIFHKDITTPLAVVNVLYDVGARDEQEEKTGFAHLFEHLMFGGSVNIPNFDGSLQRAGGQNNAFTSNDITNYYDVLPAENVETALWLESDRMLSLAFTEKSLEVQRSVVIEEFKQRYLNQPYGDVWLEFRPLAYDVHPYRWATIGKDISHIENATMEDVKSFFAKYYHPGNAILCISGNFELTYIKEVVAKWFGAIPGKEVATRNLPVEPKQTAYKEKTITRDIPSDAFYLGFKMPGKNQPHYFTADLLSDILGRGKSSRLYKRLKKEKELVSEINAYVTGSIDTGLLMISGKPSEGIPVSTVEAEIHAVIQELQHELISNEELEKTVNKVKTTKVFSEQGALQKSMGLCFHELLGDANAINTETEAYESITPSAIQEQAQLVLAKENCTRLTIKSASNG